MGVPRAEWTRIGDTGLVKSKNKKENERKLCHMGCMRAFWLKMTGLQGRTSDIGAPFCWFAALFTDVADSTRCTHVAVSCVTGLVESLAPSVSYATSMDRHGSTPAAVRPGEARAERSTGWKSVSLAPGPKRHNLFWG